MTPAARHAAAVAILDGIAEGRAAEQVLTTWARRNRYAGSGDRAAIRDIVFDVLRQRRSAASYGGGESGRALILGLLRSLGEDPDTVFTGERFALAPLTDAERGGGAPPRGNAALDIPDWIAPQLSESLGAAFAPVCDAFRTRADVFLRWHSGRTTADQVMRDLEEEGVQTARHALAATALRVLGGARRIRTTQAYARGLVELQDAASQAVCAALDVGPTTRVLDYCAGGGGKALALSARGAQVEAHDADTARMTDLPRRAARAGAAIPLVQTRSLQSRAPYDLVVVDAPCSGSGAWRRQVEGKWSLTPTRLDALIRLQRQILQEASDLVAPQGQLAYITCSLLQWENEAQADWFQAVKPSEWRELTRHRISPLEGGDGFFLALFEKLSQP